jgi:lipopolysaccharide assembly outer membrane protein LptD (OstA)
MNLLTFKIYPKEGKMFTLEFRRFELNGQQFTLYNEADETTSDGFLSYWNVAAIIPERIHKRNHSHLFPDAVDFRIYLKSSETFEINADSCDTTHPSSVKFFTKFYIDDQIKDVEVPYIYIALSEVVAITPSGGLLYRS